MEVLKEIRDWSEVWGLLLPLCVYLKYRNQPRPVQPIVLYLWLALLINLMIDVIWKFQKPLGFPEWLQTNNHLYNTHSIVRFFLFSIFFLRLKQQNRPWIQRGLMVFFSIFIVVNFAFFEDYFNFSQLSSRLLTVEASVILLLCVQFYFLRLKEEHYDLNYPYWFVTGMSVYYAVNFFIFLFHTTVSEQLQDFAISIWKIHNITFVIMCIFIAKGLYESRVK